MERYEYIQMRFEIIPQEIIYEYNLNGIINNGKVYIKILKGVYALPQAVGIVNDIFKNTWRRSDINL